MPASSATAATPSSTGRSGSSTSTSTPLLSAMRTQSEAIPSLTSIIAWTPARARARPASIAGLRAQLAGDQGGARLSVEPAELALEQDQPAPAPPSAPVTPTRSPGRAPSRPTSSASSRACPTAVTDDEQLVAARQVAAADRDAELGGERLRALGEVGHLFRRQVLGQGEHEVGLAGLGAHRREVGGRRGEALVSEVAHRGGREPEVDALHEAVDGGDGDPVARVTAASSPEPTHDALAAVAEPAADRVDQLELGGHSGTAITSMYAHSMTVAATGRGSG